MEWQGGLLVAPFWEALASAVFFLVEGSVVRLAASVAATPASSEEALVGVHLPPPPSETVSRLGRIAEHPSTQSCQKVARSNLGLLAEGSPITLGGLVYLDFELSMSSLMALVMKPWASSLGWTGSLPHIPPMSLAASPFGCGKIQVRCRKIPLSCGKIPLRCGKIPLRCGKISLRCGKISLRFGKIQLRCGKIPSGVGRSHQMWEDPTQMWEDPIRCEKIPSDVGRSHQMWEDPNSPCILTTNSSS